jgi:hypothetical protein
MGWQRVARDHGASCDNAASRNGYAGQNNGMSANPYIILDRDRTRHRHGIPLLDWVDWVSGCEKHGTWANRTPLPDVEWTITDKHFLIKEGM